MRCPNCKRQSTWEGNPYRPFCSERCKLIDLDNWLSERYRIPAALDDQAQSAEPPDTPQTAKGGRG
jgi:endogenous inhibitor of DNA gyrase (YacG/DUF329 family)